MSSLLYFSVKNHQNQLLDDQRHNFTQKQSLNLNELRIDPQKAVIDYESDKIHIEKFVLKNYSNQKIIFSLIQPRKAALNLKCKKSALAPNQICEIFLYFTGEQQKITIKDQFTIHLQKQKTNIHVPIICRPKTSKVFQRRLSLNKKIPLQATQNIMKEVPKPKILTLVRKQTVSQEVESINEINNMSKNFLDKFNQIHEFVKQKNVKKQIFIGEKAISYEKHKKIKAFKEQVDKYIYEKIRKKVQSRLTVQFCEEGPIVRNFQGLILRWNKQKNIPKIIYEKGLTKMQEVVRKYLVDIRFQKIHRIFSLYRQFEDSAQQNNLPPHRKHEIYIEKLQRKLNKKSQISLELMFDRNSISAQKLQIQHEVNWSRKYQPFEINPRIGFDNWVAIEQSIPYIHQKMNYSKKVSLHEWICHPKVNQKVANRPSKSQLHQAQKNTQKDVEIQSLPDEISKLFKQVKTLNQETQYKQKVLIHEQDVAKSKRTINSNQNFRINEAYNITSKAISNLFSIKNFSIEPNSQESEKENSKKQEMKVFEENRKIMNRIFHLNQYDQVQRKLYLFEEPSNFQIINEGQFQQFLIKDIGKNRYNMDYFNGISYSQGQHDFYQEQSKGYLVDMIVRVKSNLIRKVSKQDKFQFDRLDQKALRILQWIQNIESQQQLKNYKLRSQIDLQIPTKNKNKSCPNSDTYEKCLQNFSIYKNELIGKSHCLQTNLHQSAKTKNNSLFLS